MSRFDRKKRGEEALKLKSNVKGRIGLNELFDDTIKGTWYLTDDEYDTICLKMTDEELDVFLEDKKTFTQKKFVLNAIDKYIDLGEYRDEKIKTILNGSKNI